MIMNKKGQNSTIAVTIAIVLGIALIVFLIWGFSSNWSMFSSTAEAYTGQTNIDTVKQACSVQCSNDQKTEFCTVKKTVIDAKGKTTQETCAAGANIKTTCEGLC